MAESQVELSSPIRDFFRLRSHDLTALAGGGLVLGITAAIFFNLPQEAAKRWDIQWGYWWYLALALLLCAGVIVNARLLFALVLRNRPPLPYALTVGAATLLFVLFSVQSIERQHRVLSDESSWESMALQMRWSQTGGVCNQGIFEENGKLDCRDEVNNFKGKSLAYAQSLLYRIFPANRDTALHLNLPLYALSILLLFYATFLALRDPILAAATGIFLGAMPIYMMQARSASTEVMYVFLLALLMVLHALVPGRSVQWRLQLLVIPLLGFFAGTRQETIFCFLAFALYHHHFLRSRPWHTPAYAALVIAAAWPNINTMAAYRGFNFQAGEGVSAHSLSNLWYNLTTNVKIMLQPGAGPDGLLLNPFYATHTWWILLGTAGILYAALRYRRFAWGLFLMAAFHIQTFVVLINSSSTFEIDINQRYILIALPTFALAMALGSREILRDLLHALRPRLDFSALSKQAALIVLGAAILSSAYLTLRHRDSFAANILYRKNKLLLEEKFLHTELRQYPSRSIFIYARPWQMLCSGFNSFSERTFLSWSPQQFAEWMQFSNGNIYLVRGQDGYGSLSRTGRIVGFKTTDQIEQIIADFHTEQLIFNSKDFGYPLTVHRIVSRKGANRYGEQVSLQLTPERLTPGQALTATFAKRFPEAITLRLDNADQVLSSHEITGEQESLQLPTVGLPPGISYLAFTVQLPDGDSIRIQKDIFIDDGRVKLLQELPIASQVQGWGAPVLGRSVENNPLRIAGRQFTWGIGSHAPATLTWNLAGGFGHLVAQIGLDDESACGDGIRYRVRGDGRELYVSPHLSYGFAESMRIDVHGVQRLELLIEELGDNFCDHGNWGGAQLLPPSN